jgi:hypothetical protein
MVENHGKQVFVVTGGLGHCRASATIDQTAVCLFYILRDHVHSSR